MSIEIPEQTLPVELSAAAAVEAAYPGELARALDALRRQLPVLIECDKELTPYFYRSLRERSKPLGMQFVYLDGRPGEGAAATTLVGRILQQLADAVRGAVGQDRIVVMPHLDLLATASGAMTADAKELVGLLYENPQALWLGFKDPSFPIPPVIDRLFAHREQVLGVPRDRLVHLVTQREARKLGRGFDPYGLYKHVSGVNAVRLRRVLATLDGEDYPGSPAKVWQQIRQSTLGGHLQIPDVRLHEDIGGYHEVKRRLQKEILDVQAFRDRANDPAEVAAIEALLPRGMVFWGPPGTGKTLFAKAMAHALGAAVVVVSGPELKSRWVGESEENLRHVFVTARKSAPAVIIFDELDSFAAARGTYQGSGVEHSMVNQLLTEMDGFRSEELVFVVGTTNRVDILDPALMRPGRFEFHLQVPYPDAASRRAILAVHDRAMRLALSPEAMDYAVERTSGQVPGSQAGRYSGDHLQALCRQIARNRLRESVTRPTEKEDVEAALAEQQPMEHLTSTEESIVATHEAGHAVCSLHCPNAPTVEAISIRGDFSGALGFVRSTQGRPVVTRQQLLDTLCVLFAGREAERLLLGDFSAGAARDLAEAASTARWMVEDLGMGGDHLSARVTPACPDGCAPPALSDETRKAIDEAIGAILRAEEARARELVADHRDEVIALRDLLLERKLLHRSPGAPWRR